MSRGRLAVGMAALAALAGPACGNEGTESPRPKLAAVVPPAPPPATIPSGYLAARVIEPTALRTRPGGRVVARIGRRTEFESPRYLGVVRQVRRWVGVVTSARPNGHIGWVQRSKVELVEAPAAIHVDLSRRLLTVRKAGRVTLRFRVAIGQPDSPTPKGRFAVTDALRTEGASPYGCCILALSAHQPNIPQGWTGGDRIAIHGTTAVHAIGTAASNGCLRTTNENMRRLFKAVTLGAPVFIRR